MTYGVIFYSLSLALILVFSVLYISRSSFMPYHRDAVQRPWQEVDTRMQQLLMALMRTIGIAWLSWVSFSICILFLLLSEPLIIWQLITFQLLYLFSALAPVCIAMRLRTQTGAKTPVIAGAVAAALSILGFICILLF